VKKTREEWLGDEEALAHDKFKKTKVCAVQ
jgi:hypothetical protein